MAQQLRNSHVHLGSDGIVCTILLIYARQLFHEYRLFYSVLHFVCLRRHSQVNHIFAYIITGLSKYSLCMTTYHGIICTLLHMRHLYSSVEFHVACTFIISHSYAAGRLPMTTAECKMVVTMHLDMSIIPAL